MRAFSVDFLLKRKKQAWLFFILYMFFSISILFLGDQAWVFYIIKEALRYNSIRAFVCLWRMFTKYQPSVRVAKSTNGGSMHPNKEMAKGRIESHLLILSFVKWILQLQKNQKQNNTNIQSCCRPDNSEKYKDSFRKYTRLSDEKFDAQNYLLRCILLLPILIRFFKKLKFWKDFVNKNKKNMYLNFPGVWKWS